MDGVFEASSLALRRCIVRTCHAIPLEKKGYHRDFPSCRRTRPGRRTAHFTIACRAYGPSPTRDQNSPKHWLLHLLIDFFVANHLLLLPSMASRSYCRRRSAPRSRSSPPTSTAVISSWNGRKTRKIWIRSEQRPPGMCAAQPTEGEQQSAKRPQARARVATTSPTWTVDFTATLSVC